MKKIAVIGSNGQLGNCIRKIAPDFELDYEFIFTDSSILDVTDEGQVNDFFYNNKPDYCINASAYTAVDLAETEKDKAFAVNADGVAFLAQACADFKTVLIHVSTDYVFDGDTNLPYSEDDFTNPIGVYGASKRKGEELALEINPHTIILRTSWLYSEFNKNFVKTMLNLFTQKKNWELLLISTGSLQMQMTWQKPSWRSFRLLKRPMEYFIFQTIRKQPGSNLPKKLQNFQNLLLS